MYIEYPRLAHSNPNEDTRTNIVHACYSEVLKDKGKIYFIYVLV